MVTCELICGRRICNRSFGKYDASLNTATRTAVDLAQGSAGPSYELREHVGFVRLSYGPEYVRDGRLPPKRPGFRYARQGRGWLREVEYVKQAANLWTTASIGSRFEIQCGCGAVYRRNPVRLARDIYENRRSYLLLE